MSSQKYTAGQKVLQALAIFMGYFLKNGSIDATVLPVCSDLKDRYKQKKGAKQKICLTPSSHKISCGITFYLFLFQASFPYTKQRLADLLLLFAVKSSDWLQYVCAITKFT